MSPLAASDSFWFIACNFIKKRNSGEDVFLWILQNFWNRFFDRAPADNCFFCLYVNFSFIEHFSETDYFMYKL